MARPSRFLPPGQPQHIIQRGNNRNRVFFGEEDYRFYLKCLAEACSRYACDVHAYVLMTNHVHLLASPRSEDGLPRAMQSVGRRYAQFINWRRERTGSLWEGRYRSCAVDTEAYFLVCSRYIELYPVRAAIVIQPDEYSWSSFHANAVGRHDALVTSHPLYVALGASVAERCCAYRMLFEQDIESAVLDQIREATQKGWPLGDKAFRDAVGALSGRRASPAPRGGLRTGCGRPRKSIDSDPIDF
ncbi:MAG: transposase [Nevskiaceae bacterium]